MIETSNSVHDGYFQFISIAMQILLPAGTILLLVGVIMQAINWISTRPKNQKYRHIYAYGLLTIIAATILLMIYNWTADITYIDDPNDYDRLNGVLFITYPIMVFSGLIFLMSGFVNFYFAQGKPGFDKSKYSRDFLWSFLLFFMGLLSFSSYAGFSQNDSSFSYKQFISVIQFLTGMSLLFIIPTMFVMGVVCLLAGAYKKSQIQKNTDIEKQDFKKNYFWGRLLILTSIALIIPLFFWLISSIGMLTV